MPLPLARALSAIALLLAASDAAAFVRTRTEDGHHFLWWPTRQVGYAIQTDCALRPGPDGGVPPPEAVSAGEDAQTYREMCHQAVELSFLAWQNVGDVAAGGTGCTDLLLPFTGDLPTREVGFDPSPGAQNANLVLFQPQLCNSGSDPAFWIAPQNDPCWADDSCDGTYGCFSHGAEVVALTTTTYRPDDGMLVDADIEVNAAPPPDGFDLSAEHVTPLPGTSDVEDTVTHEAGHFIGLGHNCGDPGTPVCTPALAAASVMFPSALPGETTKRVLKADDIAAICHVYPKGTGTALVNLFDLAGGPKVEVTGGLANCSTAALADPFLPALLATLLLRRRRR